MKNVKYLGKEAHSWGGEVEGGGGEGEGTPRDIRPGYLSSPQLLSTYDTFELIVVSI